MSLRSSASAPKVNRSAAVVALLGCLVVASLFALLFVQTRNGERRALRDQLATTAAEQVALLKGRSAAVQQVIDTLASLWEVDLVSSRQDFAAFAKRALPEHPELRALEWVPRVSVADRVAYEHAARDDGFSDFKFKALGGPRSSASATQELFPTYYVEPLQGNEASLGLDLASDPVMREGLERARDSGRQTATGTVSLAQGSDDLGFVIVAPVYCRAASVTTPEGRRRALMGFIAGVLRFEDLASAAVADLHGRQLPMTIDEAEAVSRSTVTGPAGASSSSTRSAPSVLAAADADIPRPLTIDIAGRDWTLHFRAPSAEATRSNFHSTWIIPIALACTLVFGAYVFAAVRRTVEVEHRVRQRTAELSSEIATRAEVERVLAGERDALEARVAKRTAELAESNLALQQEITVRKKAEVQAAQANEAKSLFIANMSHEIRTPLNAILGYAQILQTDQTLHGGALRSVQKIATSGSHLLGLVSEVLDLSQIEAGRAELHRVDFDLRELLTEVGFLFENQCRQASLDFRLEGLPSHGTRVNGDPGKLRQILINLAANAVKFTQAGFVRLGLLPGQGDRYVFEVTDTGIGIPDGALEDVLLPFHQEAAGRALGGTGLGLAIARRYALLMGGSLTLRSKLGEGTTSSLSVPLPAAKPYASTLGPGALWRLATRVKVVALVVDDVAENRDVLAKMLEDLGCVVSTAATGPDAVRLAHEVFLREDVHAGIVFLDVRMPGMDGPAVVERLRAGPLRGLRVVAHSASALAHEQAEYRRNGFDDFLAKPVSRDHVRACLSALPGVVLDCEAQAAAPAPADAGCAPEGPAPLPPALRERIEAAALIHNATALRGCLREVEGLGAPQRDRLQRLRGALQSYDMRAVASILAQDSV